MKTNQSNTMSEPKARELSWIGGLHLLSWLWAQQRQCPQSNPTLQSINNKEETSRKRKQKESCAARLSSLFASCPRELNQRNQTQREWVSSLGVCCSCGDGPAAYNPLIHQPHWAAWIQLIPLHSINLIHCFSWVDWIRSIGE